MRLCKATTERISEAKYTTTVIVGLQVKGLDKLLQADIWQQVEDVLQLVDDLVVDGQLAGGHLLQVAPDVQELGVESFRPWTWFVIRSWERVPTVVSLMSL